DPLRPAGDDRRIVGTAAEEALSAAVDDDHSREVIRVADGSLDADDAFGHRLLGKESHRRPVAFLSRRERGRVGSRRAREGTLGEEGGPLTVRGRLGVIDPTVRANQWRVLLTLVRRGDLLVGATVWKVRGALLSAD